MLFLSRTLWSRLLFVSLLAALAAALLVTGPSPADASVDHPSVVTEDPRRDTPIVLDGSVWKSIQLHDRVIVAGEFTQVQTVRNGPVVNRDNIFAYNINTGEIIDDFAPIVNGSVLEMIADPDGGGFYLGGTFKQIDGEFRIRLARMAYDGTLDPSFRPEASAAVHSIDVHDGVVYLGGTFLTINGEPHSNIGAVDAVTGANIDGFDLAVAGNLGKQESRSVRTVEVHPNGELLLVVSNGQQLIDGVAGDDDRFGVALVDLNTNTVTPWRTQWFEFAHTRCSSQALQIREASFSPDGSQFAIVEKGNFDCDKIVMFNTADDGVNDPAWVTAAHDSVFSVEVTNNAVYAGGHFCFVTAHGSVPSSQAATYPWDEKPVACDIGTGNVDTDGFVARQQIVALDPGTGELLDWNPKSNAIVGVLDIESIDRGLLVGHDADRLNQILTGRHAFLDFGGTTPTYVPPVFGCTATADNDVVTLTWSDNNASSTVVRRDGRWLATVNDANEYTTTGVGDYVIRLREGNVVTDLPCSGGGGGNPDPDPDPNPPTLPDSGCVGTVNNGEVALAWAENTATSTVVRRDGSWVATVTGNTHAATGTGDYLIRLRVNGAVVDLPCVLDDVSPPTPEPEPPTPREDLECFITSNDGQTTLTWTENDASTQVVRRNGSWFATVSNVATSFDTTRTGVFVIRLRFAGEVVDLSCVTPPPEPQPTGNRALGQRTTQSSTRAGGVSSRAVDGATSGIWKEDSVTHTDPESQPWWQVDLGESGSISTIELWNRTDDCCTARLSDVVVFVSGTDMTGRSLADLEADPSVMSFSVDGALAATTTVDADVNGRFVRVQLRGTSPLSLAEVRVNS